MPALSRSSRIWLLLVIDVCFFFTELILGYVIGSLALVADSFHMLNDVLSLVVALYAIKLSGRQSDHQYTYGWHRAEILAALVNGVFLLAICFSIFLESIERFFDIKEIKEPKLVVIVGCLGLASNIVGLFLFHEHGHSHSHSHSHSPAHHSHQSPPMPEHGSIRSQHGVNGIPPIEHAIERRESYSSLDGHPAAMRASLVRAANDIALSAVRPASPPQMHDSKSREHETAKGADLGEIEYEGGVRGYGSPHTLDSAHIAAAALPTLDTAEQAGSSRSAAAPHAAEHSHEGSMNMRGVLIHVLGDALGNIGVVAVGLVIWLSSWHGRFYLDPAISLALTVLIGSSALPLVRAAARVLLQGVPRGVELADVHRAIERVPGVRAVHELHVWQLSEARAVASVHVRAARDRDFMALAADIRAALHARGVHSCTVQPEYGAWEHDAAESSAETLCLIGCPPDQACNEKNACCPAPVAPV